MSVVSRQRARFAALLDGAVVGPLGDGVDLGGAEGLENGVAPLETLRFHLAVVVEVGKLAPLPLDSQAIFGNILALFENSLIHDHIMNRPRYLGVRSGEHCVCKLM